MENVYEICFYGGLALAVLLLIAAIVLFFVLKIPKVIGDLTGKSAKKAMKAMQDGTAKPGSAARKEQEKYYNMGSGKITVKETVSGAEVRRSTGNDSTELLDQEADKEKRFVETDILRPGINDYETAAGEETEILDDELFADSDSKTDVLSANGYAGDDGETDVLSANGYAGDDGETDVLSANGYAGDDGETDVLSANGYAGDDGETDVLRSDAGDDGSGETEVLDATDVLRDNPSGRLAGKAKVIYNIVVVHTDETI